MSMSRECSCCHEAGHAAAWIANGDRLLLVVGYKEAFAQVAPEQWDICLGDITERSPVEIADACYGPSHSAGLTKREGRSDLVECSECAQSQRSDHCAGCRNLISNQIACHLAGGAATAYLLSEQHNELQSADDIKKVKKLLEEFSQDEGLRRTLRSDAEDRARLLVRRETRAIELLAAALLQRGVLSGADAEKMLRAI